MMRFLMKIKLGNVDIIDNGICPHSNEYVQRIIRNMAKGNDVARDS